MTVKWCEPFEDLAAFSVPGYSATGGGGENIVTSTPRTGAGYFQNGSDSGRSQTWNLLSNPALGAGWADFLIGFGLRIPNVTSERCIWRLQEGATVHGQLNVNASEQLLLYANGTLRATSSALSTSTWYHVSVKLVVHDTTGVAELWVNDVQQGTTFNGDTRNGGTAGVIDTIRHGDGAAGLEFLEMDDLVLGDTTGSMTRIPDCKVECDYPNGNGTNSGLTGSDGNSTDNYLLVDETGTPNTADYVGSNTPGTKDTYAATNTDAVQGSVLAVQIRNHALKSDAGSISARSIILSSGSTGVGADLILSTTAVPLDTVFLLNPNGNVAWTLDTVDAAEPGFEVRT